MPIIKMLSTRRYESILAKFYTIPKAVAFSGPRSRKYAERQLSTTIFL